MGVITKLGQFGVIERPAAAASAIKPGMLLQITGGEYEKHGSAGGDALPVFADARVDQSNLDDFATISTYADGDSISGVYGGLTVRGWLAASQTIADHQPLQSNGDGTLTAFVGQDLAAASGTVSPDRIVGYADGAITTGVGEVKPINVRLK